MATEAFVEVKPKKLKKSEIALQCPKCGTQRRRRRDSLAIGLHHLICVACGFQTDAIKTLKGTVAQKGSRDHA